MCGQECGPVMNLCSFTHITCLYLDWKNLQCELPDSNGTRSQEEEQKKRGHPSEAPLNSNCNSHDQSRCATLANRGPEPQSSNV